MKLSLPFALRQTWLWLWLLLISSALLCRPPLPIDETRYLSVAWEMWRDGNFLVPYSNGLPYSHKPPLLFWLMHAGWSLLGVNPWSARLVVPLAGLGVILLTQLLARRLWPGLPEISRNVPYLMLGLLFWSMYSTLTLFDPLVTLCCLLAWLALWDAGRARQSQRLSWPLFALALGLGILAKGPVIFLFLLPPALLAPCWMRRGKGVFSWYKKLLPATCAGLILGLAWALPAAKAGGAEYASAILLQQTAGRVVHSFAHHRPVYYYLGLLPILLFPFLLWLPAIDLRIRRRFPAQIRFCLSILLPAFILFSCISGKQAHYLLPLIPAAALLLTRAAANAPVSLQRIPWLVIGALLLFAAGLLIAPHLPLSGGDTEIVLALPVWLGFGPLLAALLLLLCSVQQRNSSNTVLLANSTPHLNMVRCIGAVMVLLLVYFHIALSGALFRLYDWGKIAREIKAVQDQGKIVAVFPPRLSDQPHFAGQLHKKLWPLQRAEDVLAWAKQNKNQTLLFFIEDTDCSQLPEHGHKSPLKNGCLALCSVEEFLHAPAKYLHPLR